MNPDVLKYIQDILDSISKIELHLSQISTITQYSSNITIVDAVEKDQQLPTMLFGNK